MPKNTVLITGGSGMVGKNIINNPQFNSYQLLYPSRCELNLRDYNQTYEYLNTIKPDIIIHCAGLVGGIQANIDNPFNFLIENLDIGRNIIIAAKNCGIKKLINLGSSCIYPKNLQTPLDESLILSGKLEPTNEGYALAKIISLKLCEYICHLDKSYEYKTLIPCNLYGLYDNFKPESSHLIPAVIHKLHNAKVNELSKVDIWGDGSVKREFMFANDLAEAIYYFSHRLGEMPNFMNIGYGKSYTIDFYYKQIAEIIGYKGSFEYDLNKPVGMKDKKVSINNQVIFGWKPKTNLNDGIKKTYLYYLETL